VRHLLGLGHRRIAYISGPTNWHSNRRRFIAYRDHLAQAGIALDQALIQSGDWESDSGYAAAGLLLEHPEPPTAIFAANDLMALGAIYRIQDAGLRVPDDVAVVGYDDRDFAKIVKPRLTTVSLPVYEMGQIAAEKLLAQIRGGISDFDETLVKGKLYVRESCGADPSMRTREQRVRVTDVRPTVLHKDPEF
jgi:DNA-binding LacI/PurR family transcriptional regulator